MERVTADLLKQFLQKLGERLDRHTSFYLVGGSALTLLGSPRETIDVDYSVEAPSRKFESVLSKLSVELRIDLERVPLEEFIPLPAQAEKRHRLVGQYGKVDVYIFDPYSIALSKLDRGFDTDIEDVVFLVRRGLVSMAQLEQIVKETLPRAAEFDIVPGEIQDHLQAVRSALE